MAKKNGSTKEGSSKATSHEEPSIQETAKHHKVRFSIGLLLTILSIWFALAFVSFLFSGASDKSKFDKGLIALIKNKEAQVENITGKIGGFVSDILFNNWFGLGSFIIPFLLFIIGIRMLGVRLLPLRKSVAHALIIGIWVSVTLGFIFISNTDDAYLLLGGAHGYFISTWLTLTIGIIGTALLLFFSLCLYMGLTFDWFIPFVGKSLKKVTTPRPAKIKEAEVEKSKATAPILPLSITENNEKPEFAKSFSLDEDELELNDDEPINDFDSVIPPIASGLVNNKLDETLEIERPKEEFASDDYQHEVRGDYDPTLDLSHYELPPVSLLAEFPESDDQVSMQELEANKLRITKTLEDYNIKIIKTKATVGPTVTLYEIIPEKGVRISKITNLENDIALSLAALGIRIIGHIPGKGTIGIEVPNNEPKVVSMRSIINSAAFRNSKYELPIALGKTINNETYMMDLTKAPHLLVAGATGQGKSVGLNVIITSLLYSKHPSALKFVLIDPKKVELNIYSRLEKHFLAKLPSVHR